MVIEKPFTTYEEVERHAMKLRVQNEIERLRFSSHCHAFANREVRGRLLLGALKDAVHDIKPVRKVAELMSGGGLASQLALGLLTRRGGFMRRLITSVLVAAAPSLLARVPWARLATAVGEKLRGEKDYVHNGHHSEA